MALNDQDFRNFINHVKTWYKQNPQVSASLLACTGQRAEILHTEILHTDAADNVNVALRRAADFTSDRLMPVAYASVSVVSYMSKLSTANMEKARALYGDISNFPFYMRSYAISFFLFSRDVSRRWIMPYKDIETGDRIYYNPIKFKLQGVWDGKADWQND